MKKTARILALLLSITLGVSACNTKPSNESKKTDEPKSTTSVEETTEATTETSTEATTEAIEPSAAEAEELKNEPLYHYTFDAPGEDYEIVVRSEDVGDNTGANFGIVASDKYVDRDGKEQEVKQQFVTGAVDNALYLDGNYGLKLNVEPLDTETYTISFWMNADRLGDFGPTLQLGSNIGMNDTENRVTWINFTQTTWGTNDAKIFPVVWNRNSETTAWPWVYAADDAVHGKEEWVNITLVATGNIFTFEEDGLERNGAKLYLDGKLVFDASDNMYGGLATEIMKNAENFEAYFGINYWDVIYKGYVDDLYFFDYALSDGEVAHLYELGDSTVVPEAVKVEEPSEAEVERQVVTKIADNPLAVIGAPTTDNAFWTSFSDGYEIADGEKLTLKFNNYSSGINNWDNYILLFTNTETKADPVPSVENYPGYVEYGVLRSDAFAWGFATEDGNVEADKVKYTWEWEQFLEIMKEAEVTAEITRNGKDLDVHVLLVDSNAKEYTYDVSVPTTAEAGDPMFVVLSGESSYIELLSVE